MGQAGRQRYVGPSCLLIRDPQCHSKGMFNQDVFFPPAADTIFFLVQAVQAFTIRRLDMFTLRQPKHEAGGKKFPSRFPLTHSPLFPFILSKFSCSPLKLTGFFLSSSKSAQRSQEGMWPSGSPRRDT